MSNPPNKSDRKLRKRAEEKFVASGAPNPETQTPVAAHRLLHELQVHQIEVEMQNEELRHAIAEKEAMEALYKDLYEFAPVGYFNLDRDGIIHSVNLTGAELLGIERSSLVHKRLDAFISDDTRPQFHEFLKKVFAEDFKQTCEAAFVTVHKSPLYVQIEAVVTESRKNCRAVIIDITERKLAMKAASQSQEIFYDLIERSPFGTYVVDSQFRIAIMNTVSQKGAFREVRPVIGCDFAEAMRILWPEDVAVAIIDRFRHTLDTGEPYCSREFISLRHDEVNVEAYEWELHRLMLPDGRYGVICYYYDSTKLRQAEAALRASEERYRLLAETMLQGVIHQDADGTIISMNPAAERILGKNREELLGSSSLRAEHQIIRENGAHFPGLEHPSMLALQTGQPVADVVMGVFNPKLAEYRWINVNAVPIYRQNETCPSEVYAVFEDITERKRADEALISLNQELESRVADRTSELAVTVEKLKAEIAERKIAKENLLRLNRLYRVLSETNHAIVRTKDRNTLLMNVCRIAVEDGGFMLAWVGLLQEKCSELQVTSSFGATGYLQDIKITAIEELFGMGPTGTAMRKGTCCICNDFLASPMTRPWHEQGAAYGIRASASVPLALEGKLIGALTLYADEKDFFDQQQTALLQQMGADISFAFDNLNRETLRREAQRALQAETAERLRALESLREKDQMLIQQSRQAAMGEMISNIAHQWRQPLNTLALLIQEQKMMFDLGKCTGEFMKQSVEKSMGVIQHMSQTIDDFRNYFKPDKEKTEFKLSEVVANTILLVEDSFKHQRVEIDIVTLHSPLIFGYRNEYAQALLNILNNARDVLTERGIEHPRVTITLSSEGGRAVITIADNAGGIPEEIMGNIFDPYFTTKGPQEGTGLGLFMSKTIIEKNLGGRLTVRNAGDGAEFRIEV